MAHPPSGPSGGPQVLSQGDLSSQGKLGGVSGKFVTPTGKRTVKPKEVESKLGKGSVGSPTVSPANKQRTISATGSEGDEGFEDGKALDNALAASLDDVENDSQTSEDSAVFSGSNKSEVEDDPEDLTPDTHKDFPASVDPAIAGVSNQRVANPRESEDVDEGFEEGEESDQATVPGSGDVKTGIQTPVHSATSPQVQYAPEDVVSPPNTSFPVPVDSQTNDASITISNTGADNDAAINGDETITIEGGGQVNKGKFLKALKAVANWFMGLFSNKIAVGLAVFFALTFLFGLLASPAGAPFVFILMAGLSAAITCGLTGLLIADLSPDLSRQQQEHQQPSNNQNPNQQNNNQSDKSSSEIDKTKSGSGSSQPSADSVDENDTAGSFFMKPNGKKAPAPVINGGGSSSVRESPDAASAASAVDAQLDKIFGTEAFDEWLNENLLRWSNKAQFAEFSKTLRGRDDYKELAMDDKLDSLLEDLHRESNDLSYLAHSPLEELDSSGPRQFDRLNYFNSSFDRALELLDPTPEHCQTMFNRLMRVLPKEQFPWVSSNLYSPLLSIGDQRKSLEAQPSQEIAKAEVSDMLRIALRRLDSYGKGGELQKESEEQEKRRQVQTVKRKRAADPQDGKPPEKVRVIEKTSSIEVKPVETHEKEVQVNLSHEDLEGNAESRARVAKTWNRDIDGLGLDWKPTDESKSGKAWFMRIKGELQGCVSELKWSSTNPFVPANATDMEKRFMATTGKSVPPSDLDKNYFEIAVEQAALAIKDKVEKTITEEQIRDLKSEGSRGYQMFGDFKAAFVDSILDAPQVGSEKTMEDAFQAVSAKGQDKLLIKSYIRGHLINKWMP
ncbi:hypothetical protein [Endozoicomonas elysicola]|uniref:Uncharacterized protein n=1 Tax=Endozoicomonas elysicola TaxID=305900 RepID=A0A081K9H9_9GAMM|nr:hypothetical protein [Endozoicomonas elysicola]KEI70805.1 hypothetical protein GV64_08635 [Endozoicomonas elysicola]